MEQSKHRDVKERQVMPTRESLPSGTPPGEPRQPQPRGLRIETAAPVKLRARFRHPFFSPLLLLSRGSRRPPPFTSVSLRNSDRSAPLFEWP
ncbi:hypothetical protein AAFF_G00154240 [Aldrovandia affinis]|uniref:Uncharacterized protein n=1 Tax=Aldrovandia affinis TaxID=143900 RepID=A0AAD7T1S4_9TELE|nr:hypothetical protein AAFF_G00154240 [Aldrovandia affinis]